LGAGDSRPSRAEAADLLKGVLSLGDLGAGHGNHVQNATPVMAI